MSPLDWSPLWLNISRLLSVSLLAFTGWLTYRSNLLLKELPPELNILLSPPETIARLFFAGFCLFLAWLSGLPAADLGLTITHFWSSLGLGLAIGLITQLAVALMTQAAIQRFGRRIYSSWLILNILPKTRGQWLWLPLAFIPPVLMEELLFRTLLLGLFGKLIPLPLLIISTSILFGLMHQPQGRLGMIVAGVINVWFAVVFVLTGQLFITFMAHYTVNLLQVIFAHFQREWLRELEAPATANLIDKSRVE
jgi:membrane protease YdiL (CAAX protease family)